ncbi:MAG TPA: hypothetical protein VNB64_11615 [Solirubrobacteraceae bacterium]|nr:hypothetical protein [Solirubrobacteraceae bacterium]
MTVRHTLLVAACCAAVLPGAALAAGPGPARDLVMTDPAGDANGVNDQGSEHLVGNVVSPAASAAEADLLRVRLSPLRERSRVVGWSVAFRTAGRIGPHGRSGQDLQYGLVGQPTPDCRFVVEFTTNGVGRGVAHYGDSGGCGAGPRLVRLPAVVDGSSVRVDLPYRLLPEQLRPGTVLPDVSAWARLAPEALTPVGELDNVLRGPHSYRLPAER